VLLFKPKYFFPVIAIFTVLTAFTTFENDWVLKKQGEEVRVYNRSLDTTTIKELKAVTQIKTSLSSIIALLNDRETYPQWVYKCGESRLIKKISDEEGIYYQNVVAPWPVDNRDFVVDVKVWQEADTKVVHQTSTCIPDYIPKKEGHVRITQFKALWTLTPLKNGMVNCEYELLVNPGGSIPIWLVNIAATDGPYETTVNLRTWVLKDKYQKTKFSFIKEP
jgi:ribosome-associated toxin RatA of RatAB toxin-antitoxin module